MQVTMKIPNGCDQIATDFGRIDILVNNAGLTRDTRLREGQKTLGFSD